MKTNLRTLLLCIVSLAIYGFVLLKPATVLGNNPPEVILLYPNCKITVFKGDTVFIESSSTDSDGYIDSTFLIINGQIIDSTNQPNANFLWTTDFSGEYEVQIKSIDDNGDFTLSPKQFIKVNEGLNSTQLLMQDDYSNRAIFKDNSLLTLWNGYSFPQTAFELTNLLGQQSITLTPEGKSNSNYWRFDGLKTLTSIDYDIPDTDRDGKMTQLEFDIIFNSLNGSGESGRMVITLVHDYPNTTPAISDLYNLGLDHPYGRPAYNIRIRNNRKGQGGPLMLYGGGLDKEGEWEHFHNNWWIPGFSSGTGGIAPGSEPNDYPIGTTKKNNMHIVSATEWMHYTWKIYPEHMELYFRKTVEDSTFDKLALYMSTPKEISEQYIVDKLNADHNTSISSPPTLYHYFDSFEAVRVYWRGARNANFANFTMTSRPYKSIVKPFCKPITLDTARISGNWSDPTIWANNEVPSSSSKVIIEADITLNGFQEADSIVINGGKLTINSGVNQLTTNSVEINQGGELILKESSFLQNPDGQEIEVIVNAGAVFTDSSLSASPNVTLVDGGILIDNIEDNSNIKVKRSLLNTLGNRGYYVCTPSTTSTAADFIDGFSGARMWQWNESNGTWSQLNSSDLLQVGKGYARISNQNDTVSILSGVKNKGEVTLGLTRDLSRTNNSPGFNLVGNPYPAFLNWNKVTKSTSVFDTYWLRTNGSFMVYNKAANLSTGGADSLIPPMQAFWVKLKSGDSNGTITFKDEIKEKNLNNQSFYRKSQKSKNRQVIRLYISDGERKDEAILAFQDGSKITFDSKDADKIYSNEIPNFYTFTNDKKESVINSYGSPLQFGESRSVNAGFTSRKKGNLSIYAHISEHLNTEKLTISVYDKVTKSTKMIDNGNHYTFSTDKISSNASSDIKNRFIITVTSNEIITAENNIPSDSLNNIIDILPNPFHDQLILSFKEKNGFKSLNWKIVDLYGKEWANASEFIDKNNRVVIDRKSLLEQLPSNVYLLLLKFDNNDWVAKRIIKN